MPTEQPKKECRPVTFGVIRSDRISHGFRCRCGQSRTFKTKEARDRVMRDHQRVTNR